MMCTRGALTLLGWHLLTGHPNRGPHMCSPGVTRRLGVVLSASCSLPPTTISVLTTNGHGLINGGVEGDFPSIRLTRRWHRLLVWSCWLTPGGWEWLVEGWHHMRSLWQWGLWQQGPQQWGPQHLSLPVYSSSQ